MEENQVPNPEQFNISGNQRKPKKTGPVKGILLALLIVFLICIVGLLIRMVIAGDGDYFKPIKDIFGIEGEKEEKKTSNTSLNAEVPVSSGARYALLSEETNGKDVKHYRLTIDMKDYIGTILDEFTSTNDIYDDYSFDEDYNYEDYDFEDYDYEDYDFEDYDYEDSSETNSFSDTLNNMMEVGVMLLQQVGDLVDGEMYFDVFFEGNEIIQVVVGYDYNKFAKNLYDFMIEEYEDSFEEEGINSFEEFLNYMNESIESMLDKDEICSSMMESMDEETVATMKTMGIKEKDIKEAIDFNCDSGIFEFYINGTTKIKAIISMALEGEDTQSQIDNYEEENNVKIDRDNIIEEMIKIANDDDESKELGIEFVEVK